MIARFTTVALAMAAAGCVGTAAPTIDIDGVPLPATVVAGGAPDQLGGLWLGRWGEGLKHAFVIEAPDQAVYAVGVAPEYGIKPSWVRPELEVSDTGATVRGRVFEADYRLSRTGRLWAEYRSGESVASALLTRHDLDAVRSGAVGPVWSVGERIMLPTRLREGGAPVGLETVIYKPDGPGPFPLAVINHGSTGRGTRPELFTQTWSDAVIADYLVARGYLVAYPQRRGRGRSDGLYDEGFRPDRSAYTCDVGPTLAGAARGLEDIDAAIAALQARPDVTDAPVVIMGQSRGGILSVAYSGAYPDKVKAVVNFVGGWLGEGCPTAAEVNQTLMRQGVGFGRPMVWLYGDGDQFYSLAHMRANHAAFVAAGGQAPFTEIDVPGTKTGHSVRSVPRLWVPVVDAYLDSLR